MYPETPRSELSTLSWSALEVVNTTTGVLFSTPFFFAAFRNSMPFIFGIFRSKRTIPGLLFLASIRYVSASSPSEATIKGFVILSSLSARLTVITSTMSSSTSIISRFFFMVHRPPYTLFRDCKVKCAPLAQFRFHCYLPPIHIDNLPYDRESYPRTLNLITRF